MAAMSSGTLVASVCGFRLVLVRPLADHDGRYDEARQGVVLFIECRPQL